MVSTAKPKYPSFLPMIILSGSWITVHRLTVFLCPWDRGGKTKNNGNYVEPNGTRSRSFRGLCYILICFTENRYGEVALRDHSNNDCKRDLLLITYKDGMKRLNNEIKVKKDTIEILASQKRKYGYSKWDKIQMGTYWAIRLANTIFCFLFPTNGIKKKLVWFY